MPMRGLHRQLRVREANGALGQRRPAFSFLPVSCQFVEEWSRGGAVVDDYAITEDEGCAGFHRDGPGGDNARVQHAHITMVVP